MLFASNLKLHTNALFASDALLATYAPITSSNTSVALPSGVHLSSVVDGGGAHANDTNFFNFGSTATTLDSSAPSASKTRPVTVALNPATTPSAPSGAVWEKSEADGKGYNNDLTGVQRGLCMPFVKWQARETHSRGAFKSRQPRHTSSDHCEGNLMMVCGYACGIDLHLSWNCVVKSDAFVKMYSSLDGSANLE